MGRQPENVGREEAQGNEFNSQLSASNRRRGVLDTLKEASTIREIAAVSPLVSFGLYRFLPALIHWCAPVADTGE